MIKKNLFLKILLGAVLLIGFYYYFKGPPAEVLIEDISHIFVTNPSRDYSGAVLVNLDSDSDNEIFVSVIKDKNLFYKFHRGELVPLNLPELEDKDSSTFSVTACDINQDGRDELLIINSGSNNSRIVKFENSRWVDLIQDKSDEILKKLSSTYSATCIDRKGNGVYGFAVTTDGGPILYLEYKNSKVVDVAREIGLDRISNGRSILGVPGLTGHTSIFIGNSNQPNFFFVNQGNGTFLENAKDAGVADPTFEARGATLIDLNHDDIIDLAYGNHLGPLRLMQQTRTGAFQNVTPDEMAKHFAVNSIVAEDLNLDGFQDIYLNTVSHVNELFLGSKDHFTQVDLGLLTEKDYFGVSTIAADIDNNGSFEILNTHGNGKNAKLTLYSIKPLRKWMKFKLVLPNGGIPRGALLKIRTSTRDILLAVNSGSGRFANYEDVLAIGLLEDEKIISAQVLLPSGKIVTTDGNFKLLETNLIQL